ncbi:MAG TPA: aldehyde dehydrogenase family protein [Thermoanaerobaculia bacterium]|jgi:acyl-CoA reductase-like NAD-dependent aldehyde dehydrogenase
MLHLPLLRAGRPYRSLEVQTVRDLRTGEPVAEISQANRGLIARDLAGIGEGRRALARLTSAELLDICGRAAVLFAEGTLEDQGPEDYVRRLSATSGLPESLCRFNMQKVRTVLAGMADVLAGLTRGLDLAALDAGWGVQDGRRVSFLAQTEALGAVLPSNSPGVHTLWLPAYALKIPVVVKPGREEPWTPLRILQALLAAGRPREAAFYYPTDHAGATEILLRCGRSLLFGDAATVGPFRDDPRVQIHGPGWSKVIFGEDQVPDWERHLDLIVSSIADNGGRSCLNASGVWIPATGATGASFGRRIAEAVAERLARIEALPLDHPEARLAAFTRPEAARRISEWIDRQLRIPGAVDLTAEVRGYGRLVEVGGATFLLPTLVWCEDPEHPLANAELLFPFAAVVEVPPSELLSRIGSTLVATALTGDAGFQRELLACPAIDRLNLGPIPTSRVSWDQPHEGNLFAHLYRQRALQTAPEMAA